MVLLPVELALALEDELLDESDEEDDELLLDELITARRPLDDAAQALDDLATGVQLRQLLIP